MQPISRFFTSVRSSHFQLLFVMLLALTSLSQAFAQTFTFTANNMTAARQNHTATLLGNGKVLITGGSADTYDPSTKTFTATTGAMISGRSNHTATLLGNGKVLLAGGSGNTTAELYDPGTNSFTAISSLMTTIRSQHMAALLSNGKVLLVGGVSSTAYLSSAELYDPGTNTFSAVPNSMSTARLSGTATTLGNGKVLITGGATDGNNMTNTAELYDPSTNSFTSISSTMSLFREYHTATLLSSGKVLITGGFAGPTSRLLALDAKATTSAELYDPATNSFSPTSNTMGLARMNHQATVLVGNKVLITGGYNSFVNGFANLNQAELYDPSSNSFSPISATMNTARRYHTATLLNNATVLIAGGSNGSTQSSGEICSFNHDPVLSSVTISPTNPTTNTTLSATINASDQDNDSLTTFYTWKKTHNGVTSTLSETSSSLNLATSGNGDKGDTITVTAVVSDGTSNSASVTSSPVTVGNTAPTIASATINQNSPQTNDTLTFTVGTVADDDSDTLTLSYQWKKNGNNINGQTGTSLNLATLGNGDKGNQISVVVTVSDGTSSSSKESAAVTIQNTAPVVSGITINQNAPKTNDTLTLTIGIQSDADNDNLSTSYQWKKDGANISNQTGSSLDLSVLGNGDKGNKISVVVTLSDGTTSSSSESPQVTIGNTAPVVSGVSINQNTPKTNDTLTFTVATQTDDDGDPLTPSYQWRKNGANINGQTGSSLNLAMADNGDKGDKISVVVTLSDGTASASSESPQVTIGNSAPVVPSVAIDQSTPKTNDTLTFTVANPSDADNDPLTVSYQWQKNGDDINGQTGSSLNLATAGNGNKGDKISVVVTASDGTTSTSSESAQVTIGNTAPTITSVTIAPDNPKIGGTLSLTVVASDTDNDPMTPSYQWTKNGGNIQGETGATLSLANGAKGDSYTVVVTENDGTTTTSKESAAVTINNTAPVINSVTIMPGSPKTKDLLTANVDATDAESDPLTYTYVWKNGNTTLTNEHGKTLNLTTASNGDKGDKITVTVTANDSIEDSNTITSDTVTVANTAPVMTSVTVTSTSPKTKDLITANVVSSDDDGDPRTYSYVWKNGATVLTTETGSTLDLSKTGNGDTGDKITVTVTPNDGTTDGTAATSAPVTVINTAPVVSGVTIDQNTPKTNDTLTFNVAIKTDDDSDTLTPTYQWKKNGDDINGQTGASLDLSVEGNGDNGDKISVVVTVSDGTTSTSSESPQVTIGNTAPVITSATILPGAPKVNDTLSVTIVASDADNDTLTPSYQWKKGSQNINGQTGATLSLATANKGESYSVVVTESDGTTTTSKESDPVTVGNTAPSITSVTITPSAPKTKATLTANVVVSDADNDLLSYSYVWKNGATVLTTETGSTLDLSKTGNGDKDNQITVTVIANDATADSTPITSVPVTVVNTAPVIQTVTITHPAPKTDYTITANVVANDDDNDSLTYTYEWRKNGELVAADFNYKKTLDLSKPGVGDNSDSITVKVVANDGTADSDPVTSAPATISNRLPAVVSVAPQGATNKVTDKRTFTITMSDGNGASDIKEMWLLINTTLDWGGGATLIYRPSAASPTNGQLFLRRGDDFLPPINVGNGASASAILDNGAVRIVGSDVTATVSPDGNSIILNLPITIRDGLVGVNTLFARVQDGDGTVDPAAQAGDFGFIRSGPYTVTPQFGGGTNVAPTLSILNPSTTFTTLNGSGVAPDVQSFGFFAKDENGIGDIESVWFLAGPARGWAHSATFVYYPRTRRLVLRSDDGNSFLGGGQIGNAGIIENSQVKVDLSKVKLTIVDGKSFGLTLPLQAKTGLLGKNSVWLRVQDTRGLTSLDGDDLGFVRKGSWDIKKVEGTGAGPQPSNGNS
ncbi:hypothetical protein IAD21_00653 [Abditibacteriota bacterium]|nr:hypothetical protein IAD21_00653 [Abditibacteriota bacterium]